MPGYIEHHTTQPWIRTDWLVPGLKPKVQTIPDGLRAYLAEHWTWLGLSKHASVAAYARFSLQLMSLGAPAELLIQAQRAMSDVTDHAKQCFALAGAYKGYPVGPGPQMFEVSQDDLELMDTLCAVVYGMCVKGSISVLEMQEVGMLAQDPVVRAVLTKIAADEIEHSVLAWSTIQWAVNTGSTGLASRLKAEFEIAIYKYIRQPVSEVGTFSDDTLHAHGVVSASLHRVLRHEAFLHLISPSIESTLA